MKSRWLAVGFGLACVGLLAWAACTTVRAPPTSVGETDPAPMPSIAQANRLTDTIRGVVYDAGGPVSGAVARIQATDSRTITAADGSFTLVGLEAGGLVTVTAWFSGYYVGWASVEPGAEPVTITLKPYYTNDNPDYTWFSTEGADGSKSCAHCMPAYPEWLADAHATSAVNPRFLTTYNGTDVRGRQSPPTRYGYNRDYGRFPLPPDLSQPYYGPGYRLDFPDTAGNCAACHVPGAAAKPGLAYAADPNSLSGIEAEGVFCEFCHKIGGVVLDPATGLPYPNMPGVLSLRLYRPEEGQQLFFGQFDDVTRRVSYLPLIEESAFCAPCHLGVFWDTVVYDSFGEWLRSPYSDPREGKTCQDCHMPVVDYGYIVYPATGGLIRDRSRILSHRMPGAADEELLRNAVTMTATAQLESGRLLVEVRIINDRTGHHVPTDSPLRHLILLVRATDADGAPLAQREGPQVPEWGGVGDPAQGDYAGLPGKAFAKVLEELWTGISPSAAYWNPTRVLSDNRIAAFATDISTYTFATPASGSVHVEVTLLFRRAFIELMDQKGWDVPDIVMERHTLDIALLP